MVVGQWLAAVGAPVDRGDVDDQETRDGSDEGEDDVHDELPPAEARNLCGWLERLQCTILQITCQLA